MSCDLSSPAILDAYNEITTFTPTNWLLLGYHDTRDKISLYTKGTGGLDEFRSKLTDEVLYGFIRLEDGVFLLVTYVSENVSGVRRARALVHGRAVAALFSIHQVQISASTPAELSDAAIRARVRSAQAAPASPTTLMSASQYQDEDGRVREEADRELLRKQDEEKSKREKEEQERLMKEERMKERVRMMQQHKEGGVNGFIAFQGCGSYLWKRRWFNIRDGVLFLFRSETDVAPLMTIPLKSFVDRVEEAQMEVLIANSFKVVLRDGSEPYYFFADDLEAKERAMAGMLANKA